MPSSQQMQMQVPNRLSRPAVGVEHKPVAVGGHAFLSRQFPRRHHHFSQKGLVRPVCGFQAFDVLLRYEKNVHRGLGINIPEGEHVPVLEHDVGRGFTIRDAAENARGHGGYFNTDA